MSKSNEEKTVKINVKTEDKEIEIDTENTESMATESEVDSVESTEDAPEAPVSIDALQEQLNSVQQESAKNLEGWQRAMADLANFKRRQIEQASRQREEITGKMINHLLPVLDDLDLAFQNVPETLNDKEANWMEGFKLVKRKLQKILDEHYVEMIDTSGEFDPNLHEAVTYEPSPDHASNSIIAELRKGYKVGTRVLRPALVRVAQ